MWQAIPFARTSSAIRDYTLRKGPGRSDPGFMYNVEI